MDTKEIFIKFLKDYNYHSNNYRYLTKERKYCLKQQQERLKEKNITIVTNIDKKSEEDLFINASYKNVHLVKRKESNTFTNDLIFTNYMTTKKYFIEKKEKFSIKRKASMYANVVYLNNISALSGYEIYTCPNCGASNFLKDLNKGCKYCQTKYIIQQLFPVVSNYCLIDMGTNDYKTSRLKNLFINLISILLSLLALKTPFIEITNTENLYAMYIGGFISAFALSQFIIRLIVMPVVFLVTTISGSNESLFAFSKLSNKKINKLLTSHDTNYTYDQFIGEIISDIHTIFYTNEYSKLGFCEVEQSDIFQNIIDSHLNTVKLINYQYENNICNLTLKITLNNIYEENGKIVQKNEKYLINTYRNMDYLNKNPLTISDAECKHCGASIDIIENKTCCHCNQRYEIEKFRWIIKNIERI